MVYEQNLPESEKDRRTGPLDLVLEDEEAMVGGRERKE